MPDLSLADLAAFAKQGENQANSFARPYLNAQEWQKNRMANQMTQMGMPYVQPNLQAALALKQAQTQQALQNARDVASQANVREQSTPYLVNTAAANQYSNQTIQLANQGNLLTHQLKGARNSGASGSADTAPNVPITSANRPPIKGPPSASNIPQYQAPGANSVNITNESPQDVAKTLKAVAMPYVNFQNEVNESGVKATNDAALWKDLITDAIHMSNVSNDQQKILDQFDQGYQNSKLRGPFAGHSLGLWGPEQQTDNAATNLVLGQANLLTPNKLTNYELTQIKKGKVDRSLSHSFERDLVDFSKAKLEQQAQKINFLTDLQANYPDVTAQETQTLWGEFMEQRPIYDWKHHKVNDAFKNDYSPFISDEAINAARTKQHFISHPEGLTPEQEQSWFEQLSHSSQDILHQKKISRGPKRG